MGIVPYSGTDLAMFYTLKARWMAANPDAKVRWLVGHGVWLLGKK